ncbi:MAG: PRC-barrel domain-containing protein [Streptosporangiaceae bacterium]
MTMQAEQAELIGVHVAGIGGEEIGPIEQVFAEDRSGMAVWVRVRTGLFGNKHRFIPLAPVQRSKRGVKVPFTKQQIKDGPQLDADSHLSAQQVTELALYYGVVGATVLPTTGQRGDAAAVQIPAQRSNSAHGRHRHLRTH